MSILEAVVLGVVQGLTEFLPVSSSGHLVIGQSLLQVELPGILFEIVLHLATLLSIFLVYRTRVLSLARGGVRGDREAWRYLLLLALATVPAAVVGLTMGDRIEAMFQEPVTVGVALLLTGTVLWTTRWAVARDGDDAVPLTVGWRIALLMGVAQSLALVPGISRSGMTVAAALWLGVQGSRGAEFAFLMLFPAVAGATLLHLRELVDGGAAPLALPLLWGGAAAAVSGVLAIRLFLALVRTDRFHHFAPYCWSVGGIFLVYQLVWA